MKQIAIILISFSLCFGAGKMPKQMEQLKQDLQEKYQVFSMEDLYKLKTPSQSSNRSASRDMEDLVGDWIMEDENVEFLITVGTDQSIVNPMTLMAMEEADGSVSTTTDNFTTDLTYILDMSIMGDDEDDQNDGPDVLIMNMNLMDFFMLMFGMDLDSLNVENPTALGIGSSTDSDTIDIVFGMVFVDTSMIELMADSAEAVANVSVDTLDWAITFNNLSLYDSTGTEVMTVNGTIGPGMIDFVAGVETSLNFFQGGGDEEFDSFISFYDDSTGMEIEVFYDEYYGEEMADSSYFDWSATTDSLFMYFEGDDYYEEEADTLELEYYTSEDSLFMGGEFDPCEEEGFDSYEECFEYMGEDMPGLNELVDVESFYVSMERFFLASEMTAIEPADGTLPGEFKLYSNYPNPFNPVATIRFDVGEASHESTLRIFDISGRNVATLISGHLESGSYEVKWDARGFASGVYFSELISGQNRHTQKMVLLK